MLTHSSIPSFPDFPPQLLYSLFSDGREDFVTPPACSNTKVSVWVDVFTLTLPLCIYRPLPTTAVRPTTRTPTTTVSSSTYVTPLLALRPQGAGRDRQRES